jgi:hypothetical protein
VRNPTDSGIGNQPRRPIRTGINQTPTRKSFSGLIRPLSKIDFLDRDAELSFWRGEETIETPTQICEYLSE